MDVSWFLVASTNWLVFFLAVAPLVLVAAGHLFVPVREHDLSLWLDSEAATQLDISSLEVRIGGRTVELQALRKNFELGIQRSRYVMLGLVAAASMLWGLLLWPFNWLVTNPDEMGRYLLIVYIGLFPWMFVPFLAWRWWRERRVLNHCLLSIGLIQSSVWNGRTGRVRYEFRDFAGERRGNEMMKFRNSDDHCELVFYDPSNPQRSVAESALLFHSVKWN